VSFAYSRTAGFDPIITPNVPLEEGNLYGTRCPLCRNSLAVYYTEIEENKEFADFTGKSIKFSVFTTNHTIMRHVMNKTTNAPSTMEMPGGACSTNDDNAGFRPWRLENGTTLGY
jgi:hypothetical protein